MTLWPKGVLKDQHRGGDDGFTLIELLVVLVILPLIIGGIAEALIVTLENDSGTSNRISDSANAQTASEYFVRDVQSATFVTTSTGLQSATHFTLNSPQLCGSGTFLLGLYRPVTTSDPAGMDVGYWQSAAGQVQRYACSVSTTNYAATPTGAPVVVADNVVAKAIGSTPGTPTAGGAGTASTSQFVAIQPTWIATAAASEWAPVAPAAPVAVTTTLCYSAATCPSGLSTFNLDVFTSTTLSQTGFTMPGSLNVSTPAGSVALTCTGFGTDSSNNLPDFTGCSTSQVTGKAVIGRSIVTQSSISGIQLAVTLPGSHYTYSLLGSPRSGPPGLTPQGGSNPTLLLLGPNGYTKTGSSGGTTVTQGSVVIDGGQVTCVGGGTSGNINTPSGSGPGQVDPNPPTPSSKQCSNTVYGVSPVPDPVAPFLPLCFTGQPTPAAPVAGVQQPGVYPNGLSGTIGPGVYEVTGGTVKNLQYSGPATEGVLVYLAGNGTVCNDNTDYTPAVNLQGGLSWSLAPLSQGQSLQTFGSAGLSDVFFWQDAENNSAVNAGGTDSIQSAGTMYAPTAVITTNGHLAITSGRMVVSGFSGSGDITVTLTGS
jgi:prepilin-type N-terminal cleavage/methylation domain-containing protein